jgi:hypothetical protein
MDHKDFNNFIEKQMEKYRKILFKKQDQYSSEDAFHNFIEGGLLAGEEKERMLWLYMLKHYVYVKDFFNKIKKITPNDVPKIQESLGDISIYFMILSAMLHEKYENSLLGTEIFPKEAIDILTKTLIKAEMDRNE